MAEIGGFTSDWRHGTAGSPTVLTDFSAKTQSVEIETENEEKEFSVFGNGFRQYVPSYTSGTISCEYIYDATIQAQLASIAQGEDVAFALESKQLISAHHYYLTAFLNKFQVFYLKY